MNKTKIKNIIIGSIFILIGVLGVEYFGWNLLNTGNIQEPIVLFKAINEIFALILSIALMGVGIILVIP